MRLTDQIMPRNDPWHGSLMDQIRLLDEQLFARGLQMTLETDFDALKEVSAGLDKLPLTPYFDTEKNDIGPDNGMWLRGIDFSQRVVCTQAARMFDCRLTTVALLHESLRAFYEDPGQHAEPGETCVCEAPATHFIAGNVCYHGELWLDPKYRGKDLPQLLTRLMMAVVLLRWAPDYMFAMVQPGICKRGVGARYGYRNMQPNGMKWTVPTTGTLDEWVIWNDFDDMREIVMRPERGYQYLGETLRTPTASVHQIRPGRAATADNMAPIQDHYLAGE